LNPLSGRELCRLLERHAWRLLRVTGSHHVYGKEGERARIVVPIHGAGPLKTGPLRHLLKLAGLDDEASQSS
jgi:predicted RNA binding protein YcfA (HicA-like mRNA interferase family)